MKTFYLNKTLILFLLLASVLGRFNVSGINDIQGTMDLEWKCGNDRQLTAVQSYHATDLTLSQVNLNCRTEINASLPIELIDFSISPQQKHLRLNWETALEVNFDGFFLQRAENGLNFQDITWIEGRTKQGHAYRYDDFRVFPAKTYYYRLKMKDLDGHIVYSKIIHDILETKAARNFLSSKIS